MYFYPEKVKTMEQNIERKKEELELYQEVIDRTFKFVTERINQNENKQQLISELNQYVGNAIDKLLQDEQDFYESDVKDRLRVPPYNFVKRQPRDYTQEQKIRRDEEDSEGAEDEDQRVNLEF